MANRIGLPNVQPRGLSPITAQAPVQQPSGGGGGWLETIVPLAIGAITTATLASLLTPAAPVAAGALAAGAPAAAPALAPTLGAGLMGKTAGAALGSATAGAGGSLAGQMTARGMAPGPPQAPPNPNVSGISMGQPRAMQGAPQLQELMANRPQQQAQPQGQMAQPQQEDPNASRVAAMMRGFGG